MKQECGECHRPEGEVKILLVESGVGRVARCEECAGHFRGFDLWTYIPTGDWEKKVLCDIMELEIRTARYEMEADFRLRELQGPRRRRIIEAEAKSSVNYQSRPLHPEEVSTSYQDRSPSACARDSRTRRMKIEGRRIPRKFLDRGTPSQGASE